MKCNLLHLIDFTKIKNDDNKCFKKIKYKLYLITIILIFYQDIVMVLWNLSNLPFKSEMLSYTVQENVLLHYF